MNTFNSSLPVAAGDSPFDALVGEDGRWSARDLQSLMGYASWQNLAVPLQRSMATARNQGLDVDNAFMQVSQLMDLHNLGKQEREDYRLTRVAAYLLAMNGDPNKPEIAAAQMYFAAKTREAETAPMSPAELLVAQAQRLLDYERRVAAQEERTLTLEAKISAIEGEHDYFTALAYAKRYGLCTEVAYLSRVGKRATKIAQETGQPMGSRPDARWSSVKTYPAAVLDLAFSEVKPK